MSASVVVAVAVAAYFDAEYAIGEVNSDVVVAVQMVIVVDDVATLFGAQSTTSRPLSRFYGVYSELFAVVAVAVAVLVVAADLNLVPIQSTANYFHSTIFNHSLVKYLIIANIIF